MAIVPFDATDSSSHEDFVKGLAAAHGDLDVVILAFGQLVDQAELDDDPAAAAAMVQVNYTGAVSVGLAVAAQFRRQGHGRLVVLSSVAGERVRKGNFVYGSSKAGLDGFAQGLGDALGRDRGQRARRPPRLRALPHDAGDEGRARSPPPRPRWPRRRRRGCARGSGPSGCRPRCARSSPSSATCPAPVWRRLPLS